MKRMSIIPLILCCIFVFMVAISFAQEKLTLEKSVQIALEQSPVMIRAKAEIVAADGIVGQTKAGYYPQLLLSASMGKYYSEPMTVQIEMGGVPQTFSYGTDEQADTSKYSASLSQSIFTGGKLSNSVEIAKKGLEIAGEELRKITQDLKFDVIKGYYEVLKAQKFVELSKQSLDTAKSHLDRVNSLYRVGMSTRADILRGEVQVANAEIVFTKAKQGLEIAKSHFNNILGRNLDTEVELAEIEYNSKEISIYDYNDLLEMAYENRPDWRQYILSKGISGNEVKLAYSGLWPMVSLIGNYDISSTKYPSYSSDIKSWTVLLSGSWNVYDGTATWNRIKESKAKLEAQNSNEISLRRAIALEVKDSHFSLKSAKEDIEGTRKALELAEENLKIADLRYKSGVGTNLEVIDAQTALTQARIDNLQAQHDIQIAKAKINKVIGRGIYK